MLTLCVAVSLQQATAGTFVLYYEGHPTPSILYDASEADMEKALKSIPTIQGVAVEFSSPSSGACNSSAINVIEVRYHCS